MVTQVGGSMPEGELACVGIGLMKLRRIAHKAAGVSFQDRRALSDARLHALSLGIWAAALRRIAIMAPRRSLIVSVE